MDGKEKFEVVGTRKWRWCLLAFPITRIWSGKSPSASPKTRLSVASYSIAALHLLINCSFNLCLSRSYANLIKFQKQRENTWFVFLYHMKYVFRRKFTMSKRTQLQIIQIGPFNMVYHIRDIMHVLWNENYGQQTIFSSVLNVKYRSISCMHWIV